MIAAGRLRHRVLIQNPVESQDPVSGAPITTWVDLATVFAEVVPASVREFVAAQAIDTEVTVRITIRHRAGVTDKSRIIHRGQIYNVHGVLADPVSGLEYMTLPCSEGVNDG